MTRAGATRWFRGCLDEAPAPAYLLSGDAAGLSGLLAESWLERFRREGTTAELLHWTVVDMERGSPAAAFRSPSFFARARIFLLPDAAETKKGMRDEIAAYLRAPDPSALLVIPCTDRKMSQAIAAWPGVRQIAMREEEAAATLSRHTVAAAKALGAEISPDAALFLAWWVGIDHARLREELGKLAAFAGGRGAIGEAEIRQLCAARGEVDSFALADALIANDAAACIEMTRRFIAAADSGEYHALVGAIAWKARAALGRGAAAGRPARILAALARLDRGMKGGSALSNAQQLEIGLLKLLA